MGKQLESRGVQPRREIFVEFPKGRMRLRNSEEKKDRPDEREPWGPG